MWTFIHKLGSPPWFFGFSGTLVRWLLPITVTLLLVGAIWGLLANRPQMAPTSSKVTVIGNNHRTRVPLKPKNQGGEPNL